MFSVLIPTYNDLEYLKICIDSLQKNSKYDHQIIVHINEGNDGTLEYVKNKKLDYTLSNENIYWMDDTLINISNTLIDGFNRYLSLFEMVSVEEEDKKLARIRFQYYKDRGYTIESINVKKN